MQKKLRLLTLFFKTILFLLSVLFVLNIGAQTTGLIFKKPQQPQPASCGTIGYCSSVFSFNLNDSTILYSGNVKTSKFWKFDRTNNSFTELTYPSGVTSVIANFSINNTGYILANSSSGKRIFQYNANTNTWISKQPFPGSSNASSASFVVNGKAYIVSGTNQIGKISSMSYNDETWEYNPTLDIFIRKANTPIKGSYGLYQIFESLRDGNKPFGFEIGTKGYLLFDHYNFLEYDPFTDVWLTKPSPGSLTGPPLCQSGRRCYNFNAYSFENYGYYQMSDINYKRFFFRYDPLLENWTLISSNINGYAGVSITVVDNIVKTPRNVYFIDDTGYEIYQWTANNYAIYTSDIIKSSTCITPNSNFNFQSLLSD